MGKKKTNRGDVAMAPAVMLEKPKSKRVRPKVKPAPQLTKLRGNQVAWRNVRLDSERKVFALPETNTLEIETEIDLQSATSVGLGIKSGNKDPQVVVNFNGLELQVLDAKAPLSPAKGERKLKLRIFIDRSVLEVFANETVCVTKTISPLRASALLEIRAEGGNANTKRIQAWPIKTIW